MTLAANAAAEKQRAEDARAVEAERKALHAKVTASIKAVEQATVQAGVAVANDAFGRGYKQAREELLAVLPRSVKTVKRDERGAVIGMTETYE